jgi:hypothetical protein
MGVWDDIQNIKVDPKAQKKQERAGKKAHKQRQEIQKSYDKFNIEPTTLEDGTEVRSRLEALWVAEFEGCNSFHCLECVEVPLWINGSYGRFLSSYTPDLVIYLSDGTTSFVELKPNHKLAMADDRPKRALELNPDYKFVVIGGYPYSQRGVTVRMLTGKKEVTHRYVQVCEVLKLLECECR